MDLKQQFFVREQDVHAGIKDHQADILLAGMCAEQHFSKMTGLNAGKITHVWRDDAGVLCIQYASTLRWRYTWNEKTDCLEWK